MRLLFLTETIPYPLDSGGRIKTYNTLKILSDEHSVECHALVRDARHLTFATDLQRVAAGVALHGVPRSWRHEAACAALSQATGTPFLLRRHFYPRVFGQIRAACSRHAFDAVYCDHLSMLEYGRRLDLPVVLDAHNVEFEIVRRHATTLGRSPVRVFAEREWRRLERYERRWYPACRLIFAVSEVDGRQIRSLAGPSVPVVVVPIAIDTAALRPASPVEQPRILFVGGLHWPPNADAVVFFVKEIFPIVKAAVPDATFVVVGRHHERLARRLGPVPGVEFAGHVDDVGPYFDGCRVMVVPIRAGSGMRVKIVDALARGVATVATTVGCEGIDVVPGEHLLVADEPRPFAAAVVRVLSDDALARSFAGAARSLAVASYDVSVTRARVLEALRGALSPAPRPHASPAMGPR